MKGFKRDLYAEVVGTAWLLIPGKMTATAAILGRTIAGQPPDSLTVALEFGLTMGPLVLILRKCTAHLNPAITLAMVLLKQVTWRQALPRMAAQITGGTVGALIIWVAYGSAGRSKAHFGASLPNDKLYNLWQTAFGEGLGTVFLVGTAVAVLVNSKLSSGTKAGVLAAAITGGVTLAGPISGGAINPAIALGPMIVLLVFSGVVAYVVAPMIASAVTVLIVKPFLADEDAPAEDSAEPDFLND